MAKRKPTKKDRLDDFRNLTWVLNNLTEGELTEADSTEFDVERFGEFLDICIHEHGMDFRFTWDAYSNSYQATLVGAWKGYPNAGYAVSARSDRGFADCALLLAFKFDRIADRDLGSVADERPSRRKRG